MKCLSLRRYLEKLQEKVWTVSASEDSLIVYETVILIRTWGGIARKGSLMVSGSRLVKLYMKYFLNQECLD